MCLFFDHRRGLILKDRLVDGIQNRAVIDLQLSFRRYGIADLQTQQSGERLRAKRFKLMFEQRRDEDVVNRLEASIRHLGNNQPPRLVTARSQALRQAAVRRPAFDVQRPSRRVPGFLDRCNKERMTGMKQVSFSDAA